MKIGHMNDSQLHEVATIAVGTAQDLISELLEVTGTKSVRRDVLVAAVLDADYLEEYAADGWDDGSVKYVKNFRKLSREDQVAFCNVVFPFERYSDENI